MLLAELIVTCLLVPGAAVTLAVDDTLFRRRGKKVHGVGWFHDGAAVGSAKWGFGNNWVVVAVVVTLPFVSRPVALPVLAALAVKGGRTKPDLARELVDLIAEHFTDRDIHIVADAAYGCGAFIGLGEGMTMTTRAKTNAVFHQLAPARTGRRGRPRLKGDRIGTPADIASTARWKTTRVLRYGTTVPVQIAEQTCLWYGTWRTDTVRVILVKDNHPTTATPTNGYEIALVTTDLSTPAEQIITRYAARYSIEITFSEVKNTIGVGQARNRTQKAVERTVPFAPLLLQHPDPLVRPARLPPHRHPTPTQPVTLVQIENPAIHPGHAHQAPPPDHRRTIYANHPQPPTTQEIQEIQQAWAQAAA